MNVTQVLSGAGPHDAITTEALVFRRYFQQWGWGGSDHAARVAPGLNGSIVDLDRLRPSWDDVLLIHHSAAAPRLGELLALPAAVPLWPTAARALGIGRTKAHQLARAGQFPVPVLRLGAA